MPKKPSKQAAKTVRAVKREGKVTSKNIKRNVKATAKAVKQIAKIFSKPAKKTTKKSVKKKRASVKSDTIIKSLQPKEDETYDEFVRRLRNRPDVNNEIKGQSYVADYKAGRTNQTFDTLRQLLDKLDSYELSKRYGDTLVSDPFSFDNTINIIMTRDTDRVYRDKRKAVKKKREARTVEIRKELGKAFGTKTKEGRSKTTTDYLFDLTDLNKQLADRLAKLEKLITPKKTTKKNGVKKNAKSLTSKRSSNRKSTTKHVSGKGRAVSGSRKTNFRKSAKSVSNKRSSAKGKTSKAKGVSNKGRNDKKGSNKRKR